MGAPEPIQQIAQQTPQEAEGLAHHLLHTLGGFFGYGTLLLALGLGLAVMWRKKLSGWLK